MRVLRRAMLCAVPLALTTLLVTAFGQGPKPPTYRFDEVAYPDAGPFGTSVAGINSKGDLVGAYDAGQDVKAFVLSRGTFTDYAVPGSLQTSLLGINNRGIAVGQYYDTGFQSHGIVLAPDGTIIPFPDPAPNANNFPTRINNQGVIVGSYSTDWYTTIKGYIYENGRFVPCDVPGATQTQPFEISESGVIVGGFSGSDGVLHGFLRDRSGQFWPIDFPGAAWTFVLGLNDRGDLVGMYGDATTIHGFVQRNGVFTTVDYPGATDTQVYDINNSGVIVGTYDGFSRGFVAHPSR